jgi:hypothetical protein
MKLVAISTVISVVAAAADPQITPRAELAARQNSDPAFLGYVSASSTCKQPPLEISGLAAT